MKKHSNKHNTKQRNTEQAQKKIIPKSSIHSYEKYYGRQAVHEKYKG